MKAYKPSKCPITRFFTCSAGVFEMICKIALVAVVIPWGSIFVNGLIFDRLLNVVNKGDVWPVLIALAALILLIIGIYFSVRAIVGFITGTGRKRIAVKAGDAETDTDNTDNTDDNGDAPEKDGEEQ